MARHLAGGLHQPGEANDLAQRTLDDYTKNLAPLKVFFGVMMPAAFTPKHVQSYLNMQATAGRPVRGNREVACLPSCMFWLLHTQDTGMHLNPCMQKSSTKANAETPRDRYVTHDEYKAVWNASGEQIRLMMDLTYRTLQRPESKIIKWTLANVTRNALGARAEIRHRQNKTGVGSRSG